MWPMAKAMTNTVRPNARATPTNPMPNAGNAAASTAAPQPPSTSQAVPMNSATSLRIIARSPLLASPQNVDGKLGPLDHPQDDDQHDGADRRGDDRGDQA